MSIFSKMSGTRKALLGGAVAVVLIGGAALAAQASSGPGSHRPSRHDPADEHGPRWRHGHFFLRHLAHADVEVLIEGTVHHLRVDHGVVQSVSEEAVVLKDLDGSVVTILVNGETRVRVNHEDGTLSEIQAGYIAFVVREDGNPARLLAAFDRSALDLGGDEPPPIDGL